MDGAKEDDVVELLERAGLDKSGQVTLIDGRVCRQAVHILLAFDIPNPHAAGAFDDYFERVIVVRTEGALLADKVATAHHDRMTPPALANHPPLQPRGRFQA